MLKTVVGTLIDDEGKLKFVPDSTSLELSSTTRVIQMNYAKDADEGLLYPIRVRVYKEVDGEASGPHLGYTYAHSADDLFEERITSAQEKLCLVVHSTSAAHSKDEESE